MSLEGRYTPPRKAPSVLEKDRPVYRPTKEFSLQEYLTGEHSEFFATLGESVNKRRFSAAMKRFGTTIEGGATPKLTESQKQFLDALVIEANKRRGHIERIGTWLSVERFAAAVQKHPGLSAIAKRMATQGDESVGHNALHTIFMNQLNTLAAQHPEDVAYIAREARSLHDLSRGANFKDAEVASEELAKDIGLSENELWSELSRVPQSERVEHLRNIVRARVGFFDRLFAGGSGRMARKTVERADDIETTPELRAMEDHLGKIANRIGGLKPRTGLRDAIDRAVLSLPKEAAPSRMSYADARTRLGEMSPGYLEGQFNAFLHDDPTRLHDWGDDTKRDSILNQFDDNFAHFEERRVSGRGIIARILLHAIKKLLGGPVRTKLRQFDPSSKTGTPSKHI
jgi:hypothetical protein